MNASPDYDAVLAASEAAEFAADPLPGWAGIGTLFGAPLWVPGDPDGLEGWVAVGVPFDGTASSRPGAADGPRSVRHASLVFSSYLSSLGESRMLDMRTGATFTYRAPRIADVGDLHVYPTDTVRTFRSVAAAARDLTGRAQSAIFLNGDHSATFATFAGFRAAHAAAGASERIGFINIDHHFDFGEWSAIHGPLYHGANSRRVSELPGMSPERVAFVGVGDVTRHSQCLELMDKGYHIVPAAAIIAEGAEVALRQVAESLGSLCDVIYVSLDIDVLDSAAATGTGHVTLGGLSSAALLDIYEVLRLLPVRGLDVAEIAPRYDPTGATAQIVARLLFEYLFRAEVQAAESWPPRSRPGPARALASSVEVVGDDYHLATGR